MRNLIKTIISLICLIVFFVVYTKNVSALSFDSTYTIESFNSSIYLKQNTDIFITEEITANFTTPKHGIFRAIPTLYTYKGKTINSRLKVLNIVDEAGVKYQYTQNKLGQSVKLTIGDPNKTVKGLYTYIINYKVSNILQDFNGSPELYWNVTGNEWDTNIKNASATVHSEFAEIERNDCFTGSLGTTTKLCTVDAEKNNVTFTTKTILQKGEGMTIVTEFKPINELVFPGYINKLSYEIVDNWGYLVPPASLSLIYYFWHTRGRDTKYKSDNIYYKPDDLSTQTVKMFARKNIPLVYHPIDGLTPSELGTIIDEKINIQDVVAEIVEMARLGFIEIQQIKKKALFKNKTEFAFVKKSKFEGTEFNALRDYQQWLLKEIFRYKNVYGSVSIAEKLFKRDKKHYEKVEKLLAGKEYVLFSSLKNHFYEGLPTFRDKLYKHMEIRGFFAGNPEKTRQQWFGIFIVITILSFLLTTRFANMTANFGPIILLIFTTIASIPLIIAMPKRTPKGYSLYRQIEGLRWYLNKGKWRYDVQEKKLFLEEILPLAIALKVVDKLANDMKDLGVVPPSYYKGVTRGLFYSDLNSFSSSLENSLLSSPGGKLSGSGSWSGGSGFSGGSSGGGFGGGGGGSW